MEEAHFFLDPSQSGESGFEGKKTETDGRKRNDTPRDCGNGFAMSDVREIAAIRQPRFVGGMPARSLEALPIHASNGLR